MDKHFKQDVKALMKGGVCGAVIGLAGLVVIGIPAVGVVRLQEIRREKKPARRFDG